MIFDRKISQQEIDKAREAWKRGLVMDVSIDDEPLSEAEFDIDNPPPEPENEKPGT